MPRTLFTAPTQPSHDIPTLRTTVCTKAKIETSNQKQWKKINIYSHSIKPYCWSIITQHDLDWTSFTHALRCKPQKNLSTFWLFQEKTHIIKTRATHKIKSIFLLPLSFPTNLIVSNRSHVYDFHIYYVKSFFIFFSSQKSNCRTKSNPVSFWPIQ